MTLNLNILGPGRKPAPLHAVVERELDEADIELLAVSPAPPAPELKRLGERHHALARALASGLSEGEAGALVGYDPSRVSILKASPAFQELLALYRGAKDAQFAEFHGLLAGLATDAALELRSRLEESPEELSAGQLMEMLRIGADRTGYGPSSKQDVTVNVNLAERLEAARQRALAARNMIDVTPEADNE